MKVLYNVTVGIDLSVEQEWLEWMVAHHIPAVLDTGMFTGYKIYKVLGEDSSTDPSYSIQYFADDIKKFEEYITKYAPKLIEEHKSRYGNKHVAFRTLLQEIV